MAKLIRPARVFLDTSHLSHVRRIRSGLGLSNDPNGNRATAYAQLSRWLRDGHCAPVFCEILAYEWFRHRDPNRAREYASIYDAAPCVLFNDPTPGIQTIEALNECRRVQPSLDIPLFEPIRQFAWRNPLLAFVSKHLADVQGTALANLDAQMPAGPLPEPSIGIFVEIIRDMATANPEVWQIGIAGDQVAFETTKATIAEHGDERVFSGRVKRHWLLTGCRLGEILTSVDPTCDAAAIVSQINLNRCRATNLYLDTYNKYVRGKQRYDDPHDLIDVSVIGGLAYCDFALVDKRMREYVRQALGRNSERAQLVFSDPVAFVEAAGRCLA